MQLFDRSLYELERGLTRALFIKSSSIPGELGHVRRFDNTSAKD